MNELDFSGKQVLVVGGSSGIGNGIAQAFRAKGARVRSAAPAPAPPIIRPTKDRISKGSIISQLDVSNAQAIEAFKPPFDKLDVLVLAQGAVIYRRGEFEMDGFRKVLEVNLMSLMACATKFHAMLSASKGSLIIVSSTAAYHSTMGNPGLQRLEDRRGRADAHARRGVGRERHPRQRHRARPGRHQDDQGDDGQSEAARRRARADSVEAAGHARRHGRRRAVPGLAACRPTSSARPSWSMAG